MFIKRNKINKLLIKWPDRNSNQKSELGLPSFRVDKIDSKFFLEGAEVDVPVEHTEGDMWIYGSGG